MAIDPKRVKEVFLEAAELPDEAARAAYLDKSCGGDAGLRARVEALLRSHDPEGSFLGIPAAVEPDPDHGEAMPFDATPDPEPDPIPEARHDATEDLTALASKEMPAPSVEDLAATIDHPPEQSPEFPHRPVGEGGKRPDSEDALAFLAPAQEAGSLGRLDHFEVLEVVGRGGMGVVLKARDTRLQRVDALKVLAPQLAASATARRRFAREARAAAAVRDDHVVAIHGVHEKGSVPYLVMEYIAGINLDERLKQGGALEVKEVLRIGMQAARGLAAAHAQGLIHRDVKPANILLESGLDRVKLTDFGLARAADDASITQSGVIAGTPMYMSPEQARGEGVDPRSDLFSLGSVLYTLCTGHPAFRAANTMAVLKRVCQDAPRPIRE